MTNFSTSQPVALNTAIGTTAEISYGEFDCGMVHIPNGSSITSLTWWASNALGGEYEAALHTVNQLVTPRTYVATVQTVAANGSYPIPEELVGSIGLKIVSNAAESVSISLKSRN